MPGVGFGGAADVEVDQLMQQRLQHVTGADAGIGRDREAELAGDGEAEAVGPGASAADFELGASLRQRPVGEGRQRSQTFHLIVESDAGDEVIGARAHRAIRLRPSLALRRRSPAEAPQAWHRGHQ